MIGEMKRDWVKKMIGYMAGLPLVEVTDREVQFKDVTAVVPVHAITELGHLSFKLKKSL